MGRWMVVPTAIARAEWPRDEDCPRNSDLQCPYHPEEWAPQWCVVDGEADDAPLVEDVSKGTATMVAEGLNLRDAVRLCIETGVDGDGF